MQGRVGCLLEVLQTSITVVTQTKSSRVMTETVPAVFTSTITSFPRSGGITSTSDPAKDTAYSQGTSFSSGSAYTSLSSSTTFSTEPSTEGTAVWNPSLSGTTVDQSAPPFIIGTASQQTVDGAPAESAPSLVTATSHPSEDTTYLGSTSFSSVSPPPSSASGTIPLTEPNTEAAAVRSLSPSGTTLDQAAPPPITRPVSQPTVDGVFVNSASKLVTPLASSVTISLVSTFTVIRSLSAGCGTSVV